MKKFENPIEVCVQFSEVGNTVVRAVVTSSLRFCPVDEMSFAYRVLYGLVSSALKFHKLYDRSFVAVGDHECPFPNVGYVPSSDRAVVLPAEEYELQDGKIHKISFTLNQSTGRRRDYIIQGVRFVRLLGVATIEVDEDEAEVEA